MRRQSPLQRSVQQVQDIPGSSNVKYIMH